MLGYDIFMVYTLIHKKTNGCGKILTVIVKFEKDMGNVSMSYYIDDFSIKETGERTPLCFTRNNIVDALLSD